MVEYGYIFKGIIQIGYTIHFISSNVYGFIYFWKKRDFVKYMYNHIAIKE